MLSRQVIRRIRSRSGWIWLRLTGGCAILAVLLWRVGPGPFLDGIRMIDARSLAAATGIALLTTVSAAWRWRAVARGLGVELPLRLAVTAYYQSQFLNTTLPGGVLGDVHRGVRHGRDSGDVGRGLRTVAWERAAGQVVQIVLVVIVLLVVPSPVRSAMQIAVGGVVAVALGVVLLGRVLRHPGSSHSGWLHPGPSRFARVLRTAAADIRGGLFARKAWPVVVLASTAVVAGHTATFLIAARSAGVTAPLLQLLPIALLVLLAMGVPANIGGWGPREGVAAWAFAAAGLGAAQGVAVAVVYGVMALVATAPGAVVLVAGSLRRDPPPPVEQDRIDWPASIVTEPGDLARA